MALAGQTAVVSGAAMGIGRAITEILLKNGANVVLLDVNTSAGESLKQTLDQEFGADKTMFVTCDVESKEQVKAAFEQTLQRFGRMDILCNNAGILNEDTWQKQISINLVALVSASFLALEHMSKVSGGHGGHIVNTASMAGLGPLPTAPVYTATKYGVVGFTRAMALASAMSGYGVRFNAVCPCFVDTDLYVNISQRLGGFSQLNEVNKSLAEKVGLLEASDVAVAVLQLLTDDKDGQALVVLPNKTKYVTFPALDDY